MKKFNQWVNTFTIYSFTIYYLFIRQKAGQILLFTIYSFNLIAIGTTISLLTPVCFLSFLVRQLMDTRKSIN